MLRLLKNPKFISLFHILFVAPLLYTLATDQFPQQYKRALLVVIGLLVLYHLYNLMMTMGVTEGMMTHLGGANVHYITMFDSSPGFSKPVLRVATGDVVVWKNIGEIDHSVVANSSQFNSGYMKPGDSFSVQFNNAGNYHYYDIDNKGWMRGVILVQ